VAQVGGWDANADLKDSLLVVNSRKTIEDFHERSSKLDSFFEKAYGFVVFPSVGKGGLGLGGAFGRGILFEKSSPVGKATITQVSVGFQLGGQAYSEIIFFEKKIDLERFKENKFEFAAQASVVAVTVGASADAAYDHGVAIFTLQKGGLMGDASVGGQQFYYIDF